MNPRKTMTALLLAAAATAANAGFDLDSDYGAGGLALRVAEGPTDESIVATAVDSQNRILAVVPGLGSRGVARFDANGVLDTSFGDRGFARLDFEARDLAIQDDGRIIVVGNDTGSLLEQDWQLLRLDGNGSLDTSFGSQGRVSLDWFGNGDSARSVALTGDGHIVAGGSALEPGFGNAFATARFDQSGGLVWARADKLFQGTADFCVQVLIQPDGKIVCAGRARNFAGALMGAFRFNPDGSQDTAFGTDGVAVVDFGDDPAEAQTAWLKDTGEILFGGFVERDNTNDWALALAQLTPAGAIDVSFGTNGRAEFNVPGETTESIRDLLLVDDTIYAAVNAADAEDFVLAAFDSSGAIDGGFGSGGLQQLDFNGLVDLSLDLSTHQGGILVTGFAASPDVSAQRDLALARYGLKGTLDASFGTNGRAQAGLTGPVNVTVTDAARRGNAGALVAGYIGSTFGGRDLMVAAFDASGLLDTSFADQGFRILDFDNALDQANAIRVLADGRIIVAGTSRTPSGSEDMTVLRLLADGSLDTSFGTQGWVAIDVDGGNDSAQSLTTQADGKIVILGDAQFPSQGNIRNFVLARIEADGALDASFGTAGLSELNIDSFDFSNSLAQLASGHLILGGSSDGDFVIARFSADGVLDMSFGASGVTRIDFASANDFASQLLIVDNWMSMGERILIVGTARGGGSPSSEDFAAAMLGDDGELEAGFADAGRLVLPLSEERSDQARSVVQFADRLILAGRAQDPETLDDVALLALQMDGQPDPAFFTGGASLRLDVAGSQDEIEFLSVDDDGLLAIGASFDPEDLGGIRKIALLRLARSERIFRDRFEAP
jgi:uncharacterized delta-60 repeat protein